MEIDEKQKQQIGIGIGVGIVGISVGIGYWYYNKKKKQTELEAITNEEDEYMPPLELGIEPRPRLTRIGNAEVNTKFPDDYKIRRNRFYIYDSKKVSDRFKVMETHTQEKRQNTGRLRTSGDRGAYNNKSHGFNNQSQQQQQQNPDLGVW